MSCHGQQPFGADLLTLEKEIQMPAVKGRIDHMAINLKDKMLYVAALGNNTVEAIDLNKGIVIRSIKGVEEPQGIAYLPEQNEIAVASGGNGDCVFFNAATLERVATVHLSGDADNIRYDSVDKKMFVGYGNGGMAKIDPATHKQIGDIKLAAHPESFQLDKKNDRMYVNLPDDHSIAVIDLKSFALLSKWKIDKYRANFPMTLDTSSNQVIIGFRHPATMVVYDSKTGNEISKIGLVDDVDDVFYDGAIQKVLASGGGGFINVFQKAPNGPYKRVSNIASRDGARTSFLVPSLRLFIVAERAEGGKVAAIAVYRIVATKG
ncbi:MAG: YncE family protein [Flavisolibacter sp.]|nr:YncE family protein [Flavisolibacter sp.]